MIVGFFLLITAGAGVLDLIAPAQGPRLTALDQADRDREHEAATIADGSLMRLIDRELQEGSNARLAFVPWYIVYVLLPLREPGSGLVVGRDGWLFLEERILPKGGTHYPEDGTVAANILTAFDRRLAALGIDTVLLPLPRKATVAARYLPSDTDAHSTYEQDILRLLRQRNIPHVNLYEVWKGMDPTQIWLRQDTHWSPLGMGHALEAAAWEMGNWVSPERRNSTLWPAQSLPVHRTLLATLGIPPDHPVMSTIAPDHLVSPRVNRRSLETLPTEGPDVVLLGTSFTATPAATEQLSHFVNRPVTNLARGATTVGTTLVNALTAGRIPPGSQLILEVPVFQLQGQGLRNKGLQFLQAKMLQPLSFAEPPAWHPLAPSILRRQADRGALFSGLLATTGDGIVHLELTGKPADASGIRIKLSTGGTYLTVAWPADAESLHLPVITSQAGAPPVSILIMDAPADQSIQMRMVTELDLDHPVSLPATAIERFAGGWRQDRALPPGSVESRHAALWIELSPRGPVGPLTMELIRADGDPHLIATIPLQRKSTAVLRLSAPDGQWTALRISGKGRGPGDVGQIRIVDVPNR